MHRNKHGSKASLNSNDIVVVEEVEDQDISTEAFRPHWEYHHHTASCIEGNRLEVLDDITH